MRPTVAGGVRGPVAVSVAPLVQRVDVVLVADARRELVPAVAVLAAAMEQEHRWEMGLARAPVQVVELEPADADLFVLPESYVCGHAASFGLTVLVYLKTLTRMRG